MMHNENSMTTFYQDLTNLWPMTIGKDHLDQSSAMFPEQLGFNPRIASSSSSYYDNASVDSIGCSSWENTSTPTTATPSPPIDFITPVLIYPPQKSASSTTPENLTTVNDKENVETRSGHNHIRLERALKVNNYCETVAVESTAHVAQIVGKNGCRIKHLRAKFGTYIHTPSATDEPVFIIKGQRDKVLEVKQEIVKADNHFGSIKEARNAKISKMIDAKDATCIRLYIPNRYIGLVVGRNGWFVKELQLKYSVYIETPKFDLCNFFQLYGQRERLLVVKQLIYDHIFQKTGITFLEKQDAPDVFVIE